MFFTTKVFFDAKQVISKRIFKVQTDLTSSRMNTNIDRTDANLANDEDQQLDEGSLFNSVSVVPLFNFQYFL